jgi:hypothetical protein
MAIELTPSVEEPTAAVDAVRIDVSGVSTNTGASDTDEYPVQSELRCYIAFLDEDDVEFGRSYVFAVGQDGAHEFNNFIFPTAGEWTMSLRSAADDSVLKDQAITVV